MLSASFGLRTRRRSRRGAVVVVAAVLLAAFSNTGPAAYAFDIPSLKPDSTFSDVDPEDNFFKQVEWLADTGITSGVGDGSHFKPYNEITRGQMAAFLYKLAGSPSYTPPATSRFSDVPTSYTFYKHIAWLASTGITSGVGDGSRFDPTGVVTRGQMAVFLYKFAGAPFYDPPADTVFTDVPRTHSFFAHTAWLHDMTITSGVGDGTAYAPNRSVTRAQMAIFLYSYTFNAPWATVDVWGRWTSNAPDGGRCQIDVELRDAPGLRDWVAFEWTTWSPTYGFRNRYVYAAADSSGRNLSYESSAYPASLREVEPMDIGEILTFAAGYFYDGTRYVAVPTYVDNYICE